MAHPSISFINIVRLTYGLDSCVGLGRSDLEDCDLEIYPNPILYVDYYDDLLDHCVADATKYGSFVEGRYRRYHLSEIAQVDTNICAWPANTNM